MKYCIIIIILASTIVSSNGSAQLIRAYGAKIAYTSAGQDFNYTTSQPETKRRNGFNAALFIEWLNIPFISAISQFEYVQRGMGIEFIRTGPNGPDDILGSYTDYNRVDYLSIPLSVKLRIPIGSISPFLCLGPRFDFLLGYKSDGGAFNVVYDQFKKSNIGGAISLGVETGTILPFTLSLEGRYNIDLSDSYATQYLKVRNNAIDIWLGVAF